MNLYQDKDFLQQFDTGSVITVNFQRGCSQERKGELDRSLLPE